MNQTIVPITVNKLKINAASFHFPDIVSQLMKSVSISNPFNKGFQTYNLVQDPDNP